jgi:hypothetical protein
MEFDRHPDAVRFGVIAVPWITETTVISDYEEWVVSEPRAHRNIFVERIRVVLPEFLHMARTKDLGVHLQKLVSCMDSTVRLFGGIPKVQFEPVWA